MPGDCLFDIGVMNYVVWSLDNRGVASMICEGDAVDQLETLPIFRLEWSGDPIKPSPAVSDKNDR
ncbi:hypothetical protein SDC9_202099 [bioreactor metagenome]|uniref:Uncharacterized protein n=1 Tax=bioreactor metagenome TaxID=1076179 RepID=A0A645IVH9_9ZZZZ